MGIRRAIARALFLAMMLLAVTASAQKQPADKVKEEKGFTFFENLQGSSNDLGQVYKLDSTIGYDFNKHFGVDFGLPVYFVEASSTSTTSGMTSHNGIGNAYADLKITFNNPVLNFASTLNGTVPTGDTTSGFSTGRATFDWNNHFDKGIIGIRPFANIGVANTVSDTHFFTRPFTTLGIVGHFEGGATYKVFPMVKVGASLYDILPTGQQKVFSKLVKSQMAPVTMQGRHGVFQTSHETTGSSDIARDNGASVWIAASPGPFLDLELAYDRSVHYDLNTISFGVGVNLGYIIRKAKKL